MILPEWFAFVNRHKIDFEKKRKRVLENRTLDGTYFSENDFLRRFF